MSQLPEKVGANPKHSIRFIYHLTITRRGRIRNPRHAGTAQQPTGGTLHWATIQIVASCKLIDSNFRFAFFIVHCGWMLTHLYAVAKAFLGHCYVVAMVGHPSLDLCLMSPQQSMRWPVINCLTSCIISDTIMGFVTYTV